MAVDDGASPFLSACGVSTMFIDSYCVPSDEWGSVTCGRCKRHGTYKRKVAEATALFEPATQRVIRGEVVSQPLSGIPLVRPSCPQCDQPADEVSVGCAVTAYDDEGSLVPYSATLLGPLSDRIGLYCPDCGVTLNESWLINAITFLGTQNGVVQ